MRHPALCLILLTLSLAPFAPAAARADADPATAWPQYRGAFRDGISKETGLLKSWPESGPRVVWRRPIGSGFSGVSAVGDRLYTMYADPNVEMAACLKADSGETIWETPLGPRFVEEFGDGPRATPVVDRDLVFALSSYGKLLALKAADGTKVWEVDLVATFGGRVPTRGFAATPLVAGDLIVMEGGGAAGKAFQALDRATGATRWTSQDGGAGYASGISVDVGGVRQQVFVRTGAGGFVAFNQAGEVLWRHPWQAGPIAMPVFVPPNRFFASSAEDTGATLIEVTAAGGKFTPHEVWNSRFMKNHFNSSLVMGKHIYGFDNATLRCIQADSGESVWVARGFGKGSLIAADGLLFILSDQGTLAMADATPEGYREHGRFQALQGKSWTAPTLAAGRLYLRNLTEMVSLDVRSAGKAAGGM
jgi:outer membrane protein assembly factor BamB